MSRSRTPPTSPAFHSRALCLSLVRQSPRADALDASVPRSPQDPLAPRSHLQRSARAATPP